jgi:hypothetical protein
VKIFAFAALALVLPEHAREHPSRAAVASHPWLPPVDLLESHHHPLPGGSHEISGDFKWNTRLSLSGTVRQDDRQGMVSL